ncbi:glycoside hydrolase family protein [Viscerimonas tarda]
MRKKKSLLLICALIMTITPIFAENIPNADKDITPMDLKFNRLAVRRFIFSNNINLSEFVPSEIVAFNSMHPAFALSETNEAKADTTFRAKIEKGKLVLNSKSGKDQATIYAGGVNPYATYEIDIESIANSAEVSETGIEIARLGLRDRIQVLVKSGGNETGVFLRIYADAKLVTETKYADKLPNAPFSLQVQLYGHSLGVFISENGTARYLGHIAVKDNFKDILDLRKPGIAGECTFNIVSNLKASVVVSGARSYLSPGVGQADIRLVSYEDLSPCIEDGRLWFTFSCRGMDTAQSAQGVFSLDPSVFDIKFEGMIVFDHGDGLLRNDYAAHLFYDRQAEEWRAYVCDFGGSANKEGRAKTGMLTAWSSKDPRRGYSVMHAARVEPESIDGHSEDPCIFYDKEAGKWRLLTSGFVQNNIAARMYESDTWNGKFTPVALPILANSTGTSIQKIGSKHYALMGGHGNLRVHSYPDLKELGELNLSLQPHWPKPAGRIWASVVPLPDGYPYKYVLLTMDRPNFPSVKGPNWSYGALYFYGAY